MLEVMSAARETTLKAADGASLFITDNLLDHEVFNEPDVQRVYDDVSAWLATL